VFTAPYELNVWYHSVSFSS